MPRKSKQTPDNSIPHDPRYWWFALKTISGIGNLRYTALVRKFGSPQAVLEATNAELKRIPDIGAGLIEAIRRGPDHAFAENQLKQLEKIEAELITFDSAEYPELLLQIYDPPPFLICKGTLAPIDREAVAVVGSRVCTEYGKQVTEALTFDLVKAGFTIVSGIARGIDAVAHRSALKAGGRTIGVLGCGLDIIYPPEHKKLYQEISESGAVLTEFFFGLKPDKYNFPTRNRIISGLSRGTVVIEARRSSGALSTAHHALEQNREVFAVPGNITSASSAGTNDLLKQGAALVTAASDVLLALGHEPGKPRRDIAKLSAQLPEAERGLFEVLNDQPQLVDALAIALKRPVGEVLTLLFNLEMSGLVKQLPGKLFCRAI